MWIAAEQTAEPSELLCGAQAALVSICFLITAVVSTFYTSKAPPPAEGKAASTAQTMVNPMFGGKDPTEEALD